MVTCFKAKYHVKNTLNYIKMDSAVSNSIKTDNSQTVLRKITLLGVKIQCTTVWLNLHFSLLLSGTQLDFL